MGKEFLSFKQVIKSQSVINTLKSEAWSYYDINFGRGIFFC